MLFGKGMIKLLYFAWGVRWWGSLCGDGYVNSHVGTTIGRPLVGVGITEVCLGLRWGLVVLKFFFRREPSLKCPKNTLRASQKRIQGGGFTYVHIPLEDPPLRWRIILGWSDSSQDLYGCDGGVYFATW